MLYYIFFAIISFFLGVCVTLLYFASKDWKSNCCNSTDHIPVGSLKLVKNASSNLESIFVDFNNSPKYFEQDQVIALSVDIIVDNYETEIHSRKNHAV